MQVQEENKTTKKAFDLDFLLKFQLEHDLQIIRGSDYNYECWIDGKCYSQSLTPLASIVIGAKKYIENSGIYDEKLLEYGSLMYDFDNCKDIFEKRRIVGKMNAINAILGVPKVEYISPLI